MEEKLPSATAATKETHSGVIAHCNVDRKVLNYHCMIHQQAIGAKVMGFDHAMVPGVPIDYIRSKAEQHRSFELFLGECSAESADLRSGG